MFVPSIKTVVRLLFFTTTLCVLSYLFATFAATQTDRQRDIQLKTSQKVNRWPDKSKRFALIIGVNDYQSPDITRLEGAANDAKELESALMRYGDFPKENIISMISDHTVASQSFESLPNRTNIQENLMRLISRARSRGNDSLILIAFSGHGTVLSRQGQNEAFLLPMDGFINRLADSAIRLSDIRNELERSGIEQVIIIIDACRSAPEASKSLRDNPLSEAYISGVDFRNRNSGIKAFVTLFATGLNQRAYEYFDGSKKRGYFTAAFVEAISGAAANSQGEVTLADLIKYIESVVPVRVQNSNKDRIQVPFSDIYGYRANDLVIAFSADKQYQGRADLTSNTTNQFNNRPPLNYTVKMDEVSFILKQCSLIGDTAKCDLLITNNGLEKELLIHANDKVGKTILIDNASNQYEAGGTRLMDQEYPGILFPKLGPYSSTSLSFKFNNISILATSIKSLQIGWALGYAKNKYNAKPVVAFNDVPLYGANNTGAKPKNNPANYREILTSGEWVKQSGIFGPVFYTFEAGGNVRVRYPDERKGTVMSNYMWYLSGNTLYVLEYADSHKIKLMFENKGTISNDRIEGTTRWLSIKSTLPWVLNKITQ